MSGRVRAIFRNPLAIVLAIFLSGCAGLGTPAESEGADEVASTLALRIIETEFELDDDPTCPGTVYRGDDSRNGDKWTQWMSAFVANDGPTVLAHRLDFRGLLTDGSELAPCLRQYNDAKGGTNTEFRLYFAITYKGEGTSPFVDRLVLVLDGKDATTADARYSVMQCQEADQPPPECASQPPA